MKKVAAMQPYLFPYLGYFQLVAHVDCFVFLDDVSFIKGGYIARNSIRGRRQEDIGFYIGVEKQSQNRLINQHFFVSECHKAISSIEFCYRDSINFDAVMPLVVDVFNSKERNVARLTASSIVAVCRYLGMDKNFLFSSEIGNSSSLRGPARIIDLCKHLETQEYINAIGGMKLYERADFSGNGISLGFIKMNTANVNHELKNYSRFSIIDVLMNCPINVVLTMLKSYEIV